MNNSVNLQEAFRQFELLDEGEEFILSSSKDVDDAEKFMDAGDALEVLDVIDPNAETEEELEDSYLDKVIVDCPVCHSKMYKDPDEIEISEEGDLVNETEECPFCFSTGGFKIIGQVAPFEAAPVYDVEVEPKEEAPEDVEADDIAEVEETADDEDDVDESLQEGILSTIGAVAAAHPVATALGAGALAGGLAGKLTSENESCEDCEEEEDKEELDETVGGTVGGAALGAVAGGILGAKNAEKKGLVGIDDKIKGAAKGALAGGVAGGLIGSGASNMIKNKETTPADLAKVAGGAAVGVASGAINKAAQTDNRAKGNLGVDLANKIVDKVTGTDTTGALEKIKKIKELIKDESLQEELETLDIETANDVIHVEAEEKVESDDEMIAPVTPETEQEIEVAQEPEEEAPVEEPEQVDFEMNDFDEDSFNEMGESYLKKVYENVNAFKTSRVAQKGNKLTVEGLIDFNSGNQKKTQFIFEAKDATKSGKVRFIGENAQISKGKKAFTLTGKVAGGRFIGESLNYNYRQKDTEGKSTRVYGTIKR